MKSPKKSAPAGKGKGEGGHAVGAGVGKELLFENKKRALALRPEPNDLSFIPRIFWGPQFQLLAILFLWTRRRQTKFPFPEAGSRCNGKVCIVSWFLR